MGRLIDAEKLKQELYQQWFMDILLTQTSSEDMFYALEQKIDEIPTAYDPDKVVEQLEEIRVKKTCNKEKCDTKELCRICVVDDAIEIVKAGGNADLLIDKAKSKSGERIPYDGKWK